MNISGNLGSNSTPEDLQQDVEQLRRTVRRLQSWAQLLAGGLALALLFVVGISSWFAFSLEVQRQNSRRELEQFSQEKELLQVRMEEIQSTLALVEERLAEEGPLGEQIESNRWALLRVQERLDAISLQVDRLQVDRESFNPATPRSQ